MTISTTASRISYNGNGATTAFSFPYRFLTNADLTVIKVAANGTETTLVLNTDYTVSGADDDAGGTVTVGTAPLSGQRLVIFRSVDITQEVDYITGDPFPAETHERALDRLTMIAQQQQDAIDRSAKLSETSTADADTLIANINSLAAIEDDVSAVAAIDTNVTIVAGIAANVTTVAGIAANVTTVAGISAAVTSVATNIVDIQNAEENATAAAASASAAQTAKTNAETAEAAAEAAQAAAEAARDQVLAVYDSFDDRYLGSKTSDPTLDNDGNALVGGALYFNSVSGIMKLYTGSAWVAAYVQGAAYLLAANNLSDLASASAARANIGALAKAGDSMTGSLGTKALLETATITASAPASTTQFDVATQAVQYYTSNAANNFTLNIRASSGASLDSILAVGQSVTVALLVTNGATPYYLSALTIDGSANTPKWQGGSAPTSGNASSVDIYSVTVVKTASATFTAFASQSQFK